MAKPESWNIRLNELIDQVSNGSRKFDADELEWAREYEKELLNSNNYTYPKQGNLYKCTEEHQITFITSWEAPYTGSGKGIIKISEQIWIHNNILDEEPISVYALPIKYKLMEKRFVNNADLINPKYSGFCFLVNTSDLNSKFELIAENFHETHE